MRPLRYSINITLDDCGDDRVMIARTFWNVDDTPAVAFISAHALR
jgi:hypothetical protein